MKLPLQTETDLPPPPFGGAQGAAHRFAQDLHQARYRTSDPEQLLGEGGIGRVVIAEETLLRRPVAMKTLRDDRAGELYEARLIREARITGLLEHPSIVPVHDIGRNDDGKIYYTMKKVVGLTLREVIEHLRPATGDSTNEANALRDSVQERFGSIPARLGLFQKVCDAIAFAHAHPLRVIHRDLKPENIMVGEFGEVLVMDWGLAKVLATDEEALSEALPLESSDQTSPAGFTVSRIALSSAGQFVGTPMYAAPEQLEGRLEDIDEKSDVYALGGVLYHLLTLKAPIPSDPSKSAEESSPNIAPQTATAPGSAPDWDTLVKFIRGGNVAPLLHKSTGSKSIPEALRPLLQRALAPDRNQRIASVSMLQQAISQFVAGYANDFEEAGAWKHFIYFVKRHKGVALASAAALIIIASLTAGFTRRLTQELTETNRQLERSQVEEGRAWLERGRAALNKGDRLSAIMLAGRAIGYQGYGRQSVEPREFEEQFPLLLGKPMKDSGTEMERIKEADSATQFIDSIRPTFLPLWASHRIGRSNCIAFSNDGTLLASGSYDDRPENSRRSYYTVKLWNNATGKELASIELGSQAGTQIAFSPDDSLLASLSNGSLSLWNVATRKEYSREIALFEDVTSFSFSPNSKLIATSSKNTIKLWDLASSKGITNFDGHVRPISCVAFSLDGKWIASGSGEQLSGSGLPSDNTVRLWDVATGKELHHLQGHTTMVRSIAFTQDGKLLASGSQDHTIKLWDPIVGKHLFTLNGHENAVIYLAFSHDSTHLISGSEDGSIKLWDVTALVNPTERASHDANRNQSTFVTCFALSPDGSRLASGSDSGIRFWDASFGREADILDGYKNRWELAAFSPDGKLLAYRTGDTIKFLDTESGTELANFKSRAECLAFSPDGKLLATASRGSVKLYDTAMGMEIGSFHMVNQVRIVRVVFSPDGHRLAAYTEQEVQILLDVAVGEEITSPSAKDAEAAVKWHAVEAVPLLHPRNLAAPIRAGLCTLANRDLEFTGTNRQPAMLHARKDTLARLATPDLAPSKQQELRMQLCVQSHQFRAATAQWQALPEQSPDSPVRQFYLIALINAAKQPQIHGHTAVCETVEQIVPVLNKEMMARPAVSLGMTQLMQILAQDNSVEMRAPRQALMQRIEEVATKEWRLKWMLLHHDDPTPERIATVLTKEMMAQPAISLGIMRLMQSRKKREETERIMKLTEDLVAELEGITTSTPANVKDGNSPRGALLKKLEEVASPEWLAALQAATMKP